MRIYKNIIVVGLVILFVGYHAGITCFSHTHTYSWGTVTHSHPYSSAHNHTNTSLQFVAHLSGLLFLATCWLLTLFTLSHVRKLIFYTLLSFIGKRIILTNPRSPPVIC